MKSNNEAIEELLIELEEANKVSIKPEEEGPYSVTYAYGPVFTLLCCNP